MKLCEVQVNVYKKLLNVTQDSSEASAETELFLLEHKYRSISNKKITLEELYGNLKFVEIGEDDQKLIFAKVRERCSGIPIQYVLNEAWFCGIKLQVCFNHKEKTFIPRPETEIIIYESLSFIDKSGKHKIRALDIGTGSGCIPITVSLNSAKQIQWDAIDPFLNAIPKVNAYNHGVGAFINFYNLSVKRDSTLFSDQNFYKQYDLITANLPYVPSKNIEIPKYHSTGTLMEPIFAINGGHDGLQLIRILVDNLTFLLKSDESVILFEIDPSQSNYFKKLKNKFNIEIIKDLNNLSRTVKLKLKRQI